MVSDKDTDMQYSNFASGQDTFIDDKKSKGIRTATVMLRNLTIQKTR
jgi:hypothetical protein